MWYTFTMKNLFLKITALILALTFNLILLTSCNGNKNFEGVTLTDATVSYSQSGHNVIVGGLDKYPNATVELTEEKINVGVYTQTLKVSQEGYNDLILTATLTIKKATAVNLYPQIPSTNYSYDYSTRICRTIRTGNPMVVTAFTNYEQRDLAVVEYYSGEDKLLSAPVDAGEYKVKIILPETSNYTAHTGEFTLVISEPSYSVSFSVINPISNELQDLGVKPCSRNAKIEPNLAFRIPTFDGYEFIGWFVDNEPLHEYYDYDTEVSVIGKYQAVI